MKRRSIVFKFSLFISVILILVAGISYFAILTIGKQVMDNTVRDFLISTVEQDVSTIRFVENEMDKEDNIYIAFGNGFLEIDTDFLQVVSNVYAGLYNEKGELIYGETPVFIDGEKASFSETYTWKYVKDGVVYQIYDRKLSEIGEGDQSIWIRGVVSNASNSMQLNKISIISLFVIIMLIILFLVLAYLLIKKLLSPLKKIEGTAKEITETEELDKRIEVGGKDEIGSLSRSFNVMLEKIEGLVKKEKRFTSDVSHELRTPTTVILAESEYMLDRERSPEEYREGFEVVQRQGRKMNTLINDMLYFTRMDQSIENYPLTDIDFSEVVRNSTEELNKIAEKNITLRVQTEDDIHINGNGILLTRMIENLVSNAFKYGRENGYVHVSLKTSADEAVLEVEDNGIGISEEDQAQIYERFFRADRARTESGTGLGLAIVKRVADIHDAKIVLESRLDKGSRFSVFFKKL